MKKKLILKLSILMIIILILGVGCSKEAKSILFENQAGDFSVELNSDYVEKSVDKSENPEGYVYSYERGEEVLNISEFIIPGVTLDEKMIEEEIEMGTEMEVLRPDNIDLKDKGKFYGVLVKDTSTGMYMMYHRIQKDDKIISFLAFSPKPYTVEEEAAHKAMISTIEFK
ncbi:MAG: hypothetical protein ACRC76_14730 [Proteocatella sp.]